MSKLYLDKDGHYTSWPIRWYNNKNIMKKIIWILVINLFLIVIESALYTIVSISGKSFHYMKWPFDAANIFVGFSVLFLLAYVVITACVLIGEIKIK